MQYEAVLFDLDGTLLDTLADLGNAVNAVLTLHGFPAHPIDAYRYFVGDGAASLIDRALPEDVRQTDAAASCLRAFREDYSRRWSVETRPYEGVPELLDALTVRGIKKAILSNKPHAFTQLCVQHLLSDWAFDAVYGQRDGAPQKPDPAGALEIAAQLGIAPGHFLFVGDTAGDMQTARAAGMFSVGVLWGFRPREELVESGAQALIARPAELLGLLD
jgi:phosphoglycolate phosphatase